MQFALTEKSRNAKTGPIAVTTTSAETCPDACPLKASGACYAKFGPLAIFWQKVNNGAAGYSWEIFLKKLRALKPGTILRHNQAGDLPGIGDRLDVKALKQLAQATSHLKAFTYTHKPLTRKAEREAIRKSNAGGFTVNLSADDVSEADKLADLNIGPTVVTLAHDHEGNLETPKGRKIVICPAQIRENITCQSCQLCARADRKAIIGFLAHGPAKKRIN